MTENQKKFNFEDFLKIYPPLTPKVDPSTYKTYDKYFKKKEKEKKEEKTIEEEKNVSADKKNRRYSVHSIEEKDKKNRRNSIDEKEEIIYEKEEDEEWYLVNKGINLQNKKRKRTQDIKSALETFFNQSDLISKLSKYFHQFEEELFSDPEPQKRKGSDPPNSENNNDNVVLKLPSKKDIEERILLKIKGITSKLTEAVKILKCKENFYIIRMFEIGEECYFLLSGRLSVLKPVEYKNVKITYEQYFRYLMTLHHNKEFDLLEQLIEINRKCVNIHYLDNLVSFIKSYFIVKLHKDIDNSHEYIDLQTIDKKMKEFYLTYEDFGLKKLDLLYHISTINYNNSGNMHGLAVDLKNYFSSVFKPSLDDIFITSQYKHIFDEKTDKDSPGFSLFKYEVFICLFPGAFFGETALENTNRRRNASIRTEEDCIILSLNNDTYGSLLSDGSKKMKALDVAFICTHFFFGNISAILFNKYYFPFFKAITLNRGELLYKQGDENTSIFLLKEGKVKFEIYCSVLEIYSLIKNLIYAIEKNNKLFKLSDKKIKNLKDKYINDDFYFNLRNKNDAFKEQLKDKKKIMIYLCDSYESIGLIEYFLDTNYYMTCSVCSLGAKLLEISKYNLEKIINGEKQILSSYHHSVCNKLLSEIKRLNNVKEGQIKQIEYKIKEKIYDETRNMNFYIKGQGGEKKPFVREKIKLKPLLFDEDTHNDTNKSTAIIANSPKTKNIKGNNRSEISKRLSFIMNDINNMTNSISKEKYTNNHVQNLFKKTSIALDNSKDKFIKIKLFSNNRFNLKGQSKNKTLNNMTIFKEDNKIPNIFMNKIKITHNSNKILNPKKDEEITRNTIVNCGKKFLTLRQIKINLRNISHDMYEYNKIKTDEETSPNKDTNKEINQSFFYKNELGLSQTNFRYDLLNAGSKLKKISKNILNPRMEGFGSKRYYGNISPTSSNRVSFWKNQQINNIEEIKRFNPRTKLVNTMLVQPIETKIRGKRTYINSQNISNDTFLLNQTRDFRDY